MHVSLRTAVFTTKIKRGLAQAIYDELNDAFATFLSLTI